MSIRILLFFIAGAVLVFGFRLRSARVGFVTRTVVLTARTSRFSEPYWISALDP